MEGKKRSKCKYSQENLWIWNRGSCNSCLAREQPTPESAKSKYMVSKAWRCILPLIIMYRGFNAYFYSSWGRYMCVCVYHRFHLYLVSLTCALAADKKTERILQTRKQCRDENTTFSPLVRVWAWRCCVYHYVFIFHWKVPEKIYE